MTARNDVTGDLIATRQITDSYRDNFDRIFRNKDKKNDTTTTTPTAIPETPTATDTNQQS